MARPRLNGSMNIAQLERMLEKKRREAMEIERERNKLLQRLDALDRKMAALAGGVGGARLRDGGGRARNPKSLVATLESVLSRSSKPMSVGDILDAVQAEGYRSNSANFRAIINQTLIKEKRFTSTGRGMYQLKK